MFKSLMDHIKESRQDVEWLKGPDDNGNYLWDETLPNQSEISDLVLSFNPNIPVVPVFVTPRQIRLALIYSGIPLANIEAGISALPEPNRSAAQVTWEYSTEIYRTNPLVVSLGPALGFTVAQLDALFTLADTL